MGADHVQMLPQGKSDPLQCGAVQVLPGVGKIQPKYYATGIWVVDGGALPGKIGQCDQPSAPRRDLLQPLRHAGECTLPALLLLPQEIRE